MAQDARAITVKTADGGSKTVFISAQTRSRAAGARRRPTSRSATRSWRSARRPTAASTRAWSQIIPPGGSFRFGGSAARPRRRAPAVTAQRRVGRSPTSDFSTWYDASWRSTVDAGAVVIGTIWTILYRSDRVRRAAPCKAVGRRCRGFSCRGAEPREPTRSRRSGSGCEPSACRGRHPGGARRPSCWWIVLVWRPGSEWIALVLVAVPRLGVRSRRCCSSASRSRTARARATPRPVRQAAYCAHGRDLALG